MKKIISIAFLFLSLGVFAQTKIGAPLVRNSATDTYAITYDSLQRGGMHVYSSFAQRDAIPMGLRKFGMLATVNSFVYQLGAGLTNTDWVAFKPGGPIPDLQQVTQAGALTNFAISVESAFENTTLNSNSLNFNNRINNASTAFKAHPNSTGTATLPYKLGNYYLPATVNGIGANDSGNILLPAVATPNINRVLISGNDALDQTLRFNEIIPGGQYRRTDIIAENTEIYSSFNLPGGGTVFRDLTLSGAGLTYFEINGAKPLTASILQFNGNSKGYYYIPKDTNTTNKSIFLTTKINGVYADSSGNIPLEALSITNKNIYTSDGTLTGPRRLSGNGYLLKLDSTKFAIRDTTATEGHIYDFNNGASFVDYNSTNTTSLFQTEISGVKLSTNDRNNLDTSNFIWVRPGYTEINSNTHIDINGKTIYPSTYTTAGTTGNQTINKNTGSVNIAPAVMTLTVTNNLVTANTIVNARVSSSDPTAEILNIVSVTNGFIITMSTPATNEAQIKFWITN